MNKLTEEFIEQIYFWNYNERLSYKDIPDTFLFHMCKDRLAKMLETYHAIRILND